MSGVGHGVSDGGRNLGARVGALGDRKGRKEGGETGRNRGKAGSGMAGRVDTGSGQQKAPQGEPYGARWGMGRLGDSREGDRGHGRYAKGTKEEPPDGAE